jgi:MOSC domain-containing protein YiiM
VSRAAGAVEGIWIAASPKGAMTSVAEVRAVAGRGLEGDRYHAARIRRPGARDDQREVTLIEAEVLDALAALVPSPGDARRNLVTRGVRLNDLVGRRFRAGAVLLEGQDLCEPCTRLAGMTSRDVLRALVHRGGLRARIVEEGVIRVGDGVSFAAG